MSTVHEPSAAVCLHGIPWEEYVRLRALSENSHLRMTYEEGVLWLMSPSKQHERIAYLLGRMIDCWTEQQDVSVQGCRTVTFQRHDLRRGLEPDNCYYVQHEAQVRGRDELDLLLDPPPDLVVEVDRASSSRSRLPIYATLGVPEVWVWRREVLRVLVLVADGDYAEQPDSVALPGFPLAAAQQMLHRRGEMDDTALMRQFRAMAAEG